MPIILRNDSYHVARKFQRSENYNDGKRNASDEVTYQRVLRSDISRFWA